MIFGSEVDNVLSGQAGNDIFEGRWGNDTVHGGAGSDWMYGGEGNDKLYGDTGFSFGARTVNADDMITAGNGNDDIYGENGADNLFGNAGSDNLDGGHGDDRLTGGAGIDYMKGGSGADTFAFLKSSDASTYDFIHDFQSGVDKIDLSAIDANGFFPGNGIFTLIDHSKGGTPVIGSVWIEDTGSVTSVYGDMYGDGTPDFRIDLWDATITQSDLIL
jgi:serralysin